MSRYSQQNVFFDLYIEAVDRDPLPHDRENWTLRVWRAYEELLWNRRPKLVLHVDDTPQDKVDKATINALVDLGPLTEGSDYVVCTCGRLVRLHEHYSYGSCDWCAKCIDVKIESQRLESLCAAEQ